MFKLCLLCTRSTVFLIKVDRFFYILSAVSLEAEDSYQHSGSSLAISRKMASDVHRLGRLGRIFSMHTTFLISSREGSKPTASL